MDAKIAMPTTQTKLHTRDTTPTAPTDISHTFKNKENPIVPAFLTIWSKDKDFKRIRSLNNQFQPKDQGSTLR